MKLNVLNGKNQRIDTINVDDDYTTADYISDCLANGVWDCSTLQEFSNDIAGMALEDPEREILVDWLVRPEEVDLKEMFLKRKGELRNHVE